MILSAISSSQDLEFVYYHRRDTLIRNGKTSVETSKNWFYKDNWKKETGEKITINTSKGTYTLDKKTKKGTWVDYPFIVTYYINNGGRFEKDIEESNTLRLIGISKDKKGMKIIRFVYTEKGDQSLMWEHMILENGFMLKSHLKSNKVESIEEVTDYSFSPFSLDVFNYPVSGY